jgi:CHASE2 domain-containing sensor protein
VHAVVTVGAYGLVEGVCSSFRIRSGEEEVPRMAAMMRAVNLAQAPGDAVTLGSDEPLSPHMIPMQWWIQDDTELLHDQANKLAYARIKASLLMRNQIIDTNGIDLSTVENAIVILGSTHQAAADIHATPIGDLSGALVHANFGLELQSIPERNVPVAVQFLLDVFLIVVSSILTIPLCWLPIYRSLPPGARITTGDRMFRLVREGVVVAIFGALFATVIVLLTRFFGGFLAAWRFGMLSFVLCAGIVLLIELIFAVAEAAAEVAEAITIRFSHQDKGQSNTNQAPQKPQKEPPS